MHRGFRPEWGRKIDDLSLKCWHCHDAKTRHGFRETGPPGNRRLLCPGGTPWRAPPDAEATVPDDPLPDAGAGKTAIQDDLFTVVA